MGNWLKIKNCVWYGEGFGYEVFLLEFYFLLEMVIVDKVKDYLGSGDLVFFFVLVVRIFEVWWF